MNKERAVSAHEVIDTAERAERIFQAASNWVAAVARFTVEQGHAVIPDESDAGSALEAFVLEVRTVLAEARADSDGAAEPIDEHRFRWLANMKPNSYTLSYNDLHAPNYMSAADWIADNWDDFKDLPESELQAMKDTNTIWCLQIYPDTPIGSISFYGATMESVVDAAMKEGET